MTDNIDDLIEKISKKFYQTEEQRLSLISNNRDFIQFFVGTLYNYIMELYNKGIKLHVFHVNNDTIHAGLFPCCNHQARHLITIQIRKNTEEIIKQKIGIKQVVWEDI